MKSRKLRFLKTVGLLTGAITIIGTPIIATSCSNQDNSNNNTNKPGNDNNPGQGGDSTNKKVPQLQKDITLDVPYTSIFKDGYINVDESLDEYFGNPTNLEKYITNKDSFTSEELQSIKGAVDTELNSKIRTSNSWGNELYSTWSQGKTSYIYEPKTSLEVNVETGLKGILEEQTKLTKIAEESGITLGNKTISLDETKKPEVVNNSFNFAVKISDAAVRQKSGSETISILEIPFSSTILDLSSLDLTISSNNNKVATETKVKSNIDLDVTINSNPANKKQFENGFIMPKEQTVTTDDFAKAFGLAKDGGKEKTLVYDNKKMQDFFEIYNVNFNNFKIEQVETSSGNPGYDTYNGRFNISVDATPNNGFKWDDGSKTIKTLKLEDISIKVKVSSIDFTGSKDNTYKEKLSIKDKTQKGVEEYFANEKQKNDFLKKYEEILKNSKTITNCQLLLESAQLEKDNVLVRLIITPKQGCDFVDGSTEISFTAPIGISG